MGQRKLGSIRVAAGAIASAAVFSASTGECLACCDKLIETLNQEFSDEVPGAHLPLT